MVPEAYVRPHTHRAATVSQAAQLTEAEARDDSSRSYSFFTTA